MAVVKNLMVRSGMDASQMHREMARTQKNVQNFKNSINRTFRLLSVGLAALGLGKAMRESSKAYDYQIEQELKLAVIMKQRMNATDDMIQSVKDLTSAQQRLGVIGDEVQLAGAQQLATFLRTTDSLKSLIPAMNNLAAQQKGVNATGQDMVVIANLMGKVMDGNVSALSRVGISFTAAQEQILKFGTETERAAVLAQVITNNVGEMNEALASTDQGRMKQIRNTFGDIGEQIGRAFTPLRNMFIPALERMTNLLLIAARAAADFTNALFGPKTQTKAVAAQSSAVMDLGDAYEEASQKAKSSVAGFDEINSLADNSDAGPSPSIFDSLGAVDGEGLFGGLAEVTEAVSDSAEAMAQRVKTSFGEMTAFIQKHKDLIIAALAGVGAAFATVWVAKNWATILGVAKTGFKGLGAAIGALSSPIALIAVAIAGLIAGFVYFYRTNESFRGVVDNILQRVGDVAKWLWNSVLVPMGSFMAGAFTSAWDGIVTVAQWFWKAVMTPLGEFLLWFWQSVLTPLGVGIAEVLGPTVEALSAVFSFLWRNVLEPFGKFIIDVLKANFENLITILEFLWHRVLQPMASFIGGAFKLTFENAFDSISTIANGLKTTFIGLMNFITGVFTGDWRKAWEGVRDIFRGIFDSLWGFVKFPLNQIIDGVNAVIRGLNSLSVSIPDWVPAPLGGKKWGISIPSIPKLAKGGLAYGETLAMVGDNPRANIDPEVISPLSQLQDMIQSAVATTVSAMMQNSGGNNGDITLQVDGVTFARLINAYNAKENARIGGSMITAT